MRDDIEKAADFRLEGPGFLGHHHRALVGVICPNM
jgi:hypothetical protein